MPLARVITRTPDDASELQQYLVEHGYRVEYADPSALNLPPAELEIDLERCPLDDGLRLAADWGEASGGDIYVAPGVLPGVAQEAEQEPATEPVDFAETTFAAPEPSPQSYEPIEHEALSEPERYDEPAEEPSHRAEVLRQTVTNAAGIFADSLHETRDAVGQSFNDLRQRFARPRRDEQPAQPSMLERWNRALAERRAERQERKAREREVAQLAREQRAQREARAAALARELREQAARQALSRPTMPVSTPPPVAPWRAVARPQTADERRLNSPRRIAQVDEGAEYWRGAFTGAAVVAAVLMIAWATLGTTRPPAPSATSTHIKQDVPFGPVTLTPSAAPSRPAPSTPQADTTPAPQTHAVTPAPKPAPARSHRAHRASTGSDVADDEVVVHHYGTPKPSPTSTTARNSGPKHISDQ